jgi:CBS-domain-containing membrane protein
MEWIRREAQLYLQRISTALLRTDDLPLAPSLHIVYAFLGSFVGILVLSYIDHFLVLEKSDLVMIVGSFGAQAVLIFATPSVPLAQPWNCIVGNSLGAAIGVSMYKLFKATVYEIEDWIWTASAAAVSLSIVVMMGTKSLHPPAGATALIAVQGSERIHALGYYYILFPAVIASALHVTIGVIMNNLSKEPSRAYPVLAAPYRLRTLLLFLSASPEKEDDKEGPTFAKSESDPDPSHDTPSSLELVPAEEV